MGSEEFAKFGRRMQQWKNEQERAKKAAPCSIFSTSTKSIKSSERSPKQQFPCSKIFSQNLEMSTDEEELMKTTSIGGPNNFGKPHKHCIASRKGNDGALTDRDKHSLFTSNIKAVKPSPEASAPGTPTTGRLSTWRNLMPDTPNRSYVTLPDTARSTSLDSIMQSSAAAGPAKTKKTKMHGPKFCTDFGLPSLAPLSPKTGPSFDSIMPSSAAAGSGIPKMYGLKFGTDLRSTSLPHQLHTKLPILNEIKSSSDSGIETPTTPRRSTWRTLFPVTPSSSGDNIKDPAKKIDLAHPLPNIPPMFEAMKLPSVAMKLGTPKSSWPNMVAAGPTKTEGAQTKTPRKTSLAHPVPKVLPSLEASKPLLTAVEETPRKQFQNWRALLPESPMRSQGNQPDSALAHTCLSLPLTLDPTEPQSLAGDVTPETQSQNNRADCVADQATDSSHSSVSLLTFPDRNKATEDVNSKRNWRELIGTFVGTKHSAASSLAFTTTSAPIISSDGLGGGAVLLYYNAQNSNGQGLAVLHATDKSGLDAVEQYTKEMKERGTSFFPEYPEYCQDVGKDIGSLGSLSLTPSTEMNVELIGAFHFNSLTDMRESVKNYFEGLSFFADGSATGYLADRSLTAMEYTCGKITKWNEIHQQKSSQILDGEYFEMRNLLEDTITIYIGAYEFDCYSFVMLAYCPLFTHQGNATSITLPEQKVTPTAFGPIYEWMMSDTEPCFFSENIIEVYVAAQYLDIEILVRAVWMFLDNETIQNDTAFMCFEDARRYALNDTMQLLLPRITTFFLTFVATRDFLELNPPEVWVLLRSDMISVNNEEEVFYAALRWLNWRWRERRPYALIIMQSVRFNLLSISFLMMLSRRDGVPELVRIAIMPHIRKLINDAVMLQGSLECYSGDPPGLERVLKAYRLNVPLRRSFIFDEKCPYHTLGHSKIRDVIHYSEFNKYLIALKTSEPDHNRQTRFEISAEVCLEQRFEEDLSASPAYSADYSFADYVRLEELSDDSCRNIFLETDLSMVVSSATYPAVSHTNLEDLSGKIYKELCSEERLSTNDFHDVAKKTDYAFMDYSSGETYKKVCIEKVLSNGCTLEGQNDETYYDNGFFDAASFSIQN